MDSGQPNLPVQQSKPPQAAAAAGTAQAFELVQTHIHPKLEMLAQLRGRPVIAYFLDQYAALADEQMLHLYEHLRRMGKQDHVDLWLSSRGGATEIPWKVVSLLREYAKKFTVLLPYKAQSAATAICLGADEIVMTEMSELGPVDPSRYHPLLPREERANGEREAIPISVQDLRHVLQFLAREMGKDLTPDAAARVYTALFDKVHPLAIGALEQSWALSRQISTRLLGTHLDPKKDKEKIERIVEQLTDEYKSHLYQINRREAADMGLNVTSATDAEAAAMWQLYESYAYTQFQGAAVMNGQQMMLSRLGHIDSAAGSTIGLGFATQKEPGKQVGATWESKW